MIQPPKRELVDLLYYTQTRLFTEKGKKYEFKDRKYLKEIYDCNAQVIVHKKAAQVGITMYALNRAVWLCQGKVTVIFTMPTAGAVSEFSQGRINPSLRKSQIQGKLEIDNVGIKQIGDSFLYLRGAWNEKQAISIPADFLIHDEINFSRPNIREMYAERLSASKLRYQMHISTPTIPNYGISEEWKETDKREWHVKCKCGHEQVLSLENIIDNEFRCVKCREVLDRTQGEWRKTGDGKIPGFHSSQLFANWLTAEDIVNKQKDYKFKADFHNFVLGEEYAGGEGIVRRVDIIACITKTGEVEGKATIGVDWGVVSCFVVR